MREYDETTHANVHRGVYAIAEEATRRFEAARRNVGRFIGAPDPAREIVFTKNATEALNLVAHTWGRANLQRRATRSCSPRWSTTPTSSPGTCWPPSGASSFAGSRSTTTAGSILDDLDRLLRRGQAASAVTCMSNVLGTLNPIADIADGGPRAPAPWWWPTAPSRFPTSRPT